MWIMTTDHATNMDHVAHIARHRDDAITVVFAVITSHVAGLPVPETLVLDGANARALIRALGGQWLAAASEETAP